MRLLSIILIVASFLFGAGQRPGAVFLMIWPGARSTALAGAYSAIADDATTNFFNQAGLGFIDSTIVSLMHCNWLPGLHPGMYYEYLGAVRPIKKGTAGLHIIYLTTGETEVVNEDGVVLGTYTTFDVSAGLNYGIRLIPSVSLGGGFKFIYSYLVPDWVFKAMPELGIEKGGTGATWAFDAGVLYRPFSPLALGMALQNFGPNISYVSEGASDPLPRTLRLGLKIEPLRTKIFRITLTSDITKILVGMFADEDKPFFDQLGYEAYEAWKSVGLELSYFQDLISLRGGYFWDMEGARTGPTFGGGISVARFSLDIAIDQKIYEFSTVNRKFSLSYKF